MPLLLNPCSSSHIHTTARNLVQSFTQLYNCTHMHTVCTLTQLFTQLYNGQHIHTVVHASRVAAQSEPVMFLCSGVEGMLRQCWKAPASLRPWSPSSTQTNARCAATMHCTSTWMWWQAMQVRCVCGVHICACAWCMCVCLHVCMVTGSAHVYSVGLFC